MSRLHVRVDIIKKLQKKKNSRHVRLTPSLGMKTGKMPIDRHLMIKHGGRKSAIAARTPAPHTQTVARRRGGVLGVPKRPPPQPQAPGPDASATCCVAGATWRAFGAHLPNHTSEMGGLNAQRATKHVGAAHKRHVNSWVSPPEPQLTSTLGQLPAHLLF